MKRIIVAAVSSFLWFVGNAEAELILDRVEVIAKYGKSYYHSTITADSMGFQMCYGPDDYKSLEPQNVAAMVKSELAAIPKSQSKPILLRVYLTEYSCGVNGRASTYAAPLMLYTRQKKRLDATAVAYVELVEPHNKTLLKSIVVSANGQGTLTDNRVYIFSTSKRITETRAASVIHTLMHEAVRAAGEQAGSL